MVIGVGGFLGIGEKDVAVPYDALEFKKQAAAAEPSDRMTQQDPARSAPSGSPMAQQAPAGGQSAGESTRQAMTSENPQDNMVIVLNTSRDQLEAAPAYKYVGEENEATSGSEPTSGQTKSQ